MAPEPHIEPRDIEDVASALLVSIGLLVRRVRQVQVVDGLTMPETSALAHLDRGGPTTATALAKRDQISPQSIGATLAALEGRGLIKRRPDAEDGRRSVVSVTKAGRQLLGSRRNVRAKRIAQSLATGFSPSEVELLAAVAPLIERLAESV